MDVDARLSKVEEDVKEVKVDVDELREAKELHERTIFGGVDDDGGRTVSVLEQMGNIANSAKSIEDTIAKWQRNLQQGLATIVKFGMRAAWVLGLGLLGGLWQIAVHWDRIGSAIHELTRP